MRGVIKHPFLQNYKFSIIISADLQGNIRPSDVFF